MSAMDVVVLAWTVLMASFFGFSLAMLAVTRADRIEAEHLQDVEAIFIVESRERRNVVRAVGWAILVVVGMYVLLPLGHSSTSLVTVIGLFAGPLAFGIEDVLEFVDRVRFRRARRHP